MCKKFPCNSPNCLSVCPPLCHVAQPLPPNRLFTGVRFVDDRVVWLIHCGHRDISWPLCDLELITTPMEMWIIKFYSLPLLSFCCCCHWTRLCWLRGCCWLGQSVSGWVGCKKNESADLMLKYECEIVRMCQCVINHTCPSVGWWVSANSRRSGMGLVAAAVRSFVRWAIGHDPIWDRGES